jgi:alkanesulfonate monooxygenase SsuD/methylene tetrahydromethanopterin reductase-like flavin-dependent oxidoreductase (luciferase family)
MRGFVFFLGTPSPEDRSPADTYRRIIEEAVLAEELGFHGVWVAEHHFVPNYSVIANPMMLAVAIARATRRIRIGAASIVVPLHNPVRAAEDIEMADWLCDGRVEVAFARGDHPYEYEALGIDYRETHTRFAQGVAEICRVLRRDASRRQTPSGVPLMAMPRTVQEPHPPLWLTAGSGASIAMALDHGLNVAFSGGADPRARLPQMCQAFEQECARRGLEPAEQRLGLLCNVALAENEEEKSRVIRGVEFVSTMAGTLREGHNSDPATLIRARVDAEKLFAGNPVGDEAHIAKQLDWYRRHGVTDLILMFPRTYEPRRIRESMRAVAALLNCPAERTSVPQGAFAR